MKSSRILMPFAFSVVIGLATAFVVLVPEPDVRTAVSEDGRFEVRGIANPTLPIVITERDGVLQPHHVIGIPVYGVVLGGGALPSSFVVRMRTQDGDTLFAFDEAILAWRPLAASSDRTEGVLEATAIPSATAYGFGVRPALSVPRERAAVLSSLLTGAPPGAVGFEATDAVAFADDEFILLGEHFVRGGCNGRFVSGKTSTVSSQEVPLPQAAYRMMVRWQIGDGCPTFAPLAVSPTSDPLVY